MKDARKWFSGVVVVVVALIIPCSLMAQDSDLVMAARKLMQSVQNGKAAEWSKSVKLLKEAGLTYQNGLLAPREGVVDCKDRRDQLQVLLGIYGTDYWYAFLFGKRDEVVALHAFLHNEVTDRLAVRSKIDPSPVDPILERRSDQEEPGDQALMDAKLANIQTYVEKTIKAAEKDPELMDYTVDRFFGGLVEFIYLSSKLSLGAPGGKKLIPVFNSITARINALLPALGFVSDRRLKESLERTETVGFLKDIKAIIEKKGGDLTVKDLKGILKLVEPVRNAYIAKCK